MSKKISKEWEEEIRTLHLQRRLSSGGVDLGELLSEIDRLREILNHNLSEAILSERSQGKLIQELLKERDSLKAENEKLQKFYDTHVGTILEKDFCREYDKHDLILERDKLKAEIQRLQDNRATWKKDSGNWYESNQRMKDRIAKLREAITLSIARSDARADSYCSWPIRIALAEDDKHDS